MPRQRIQQYIRLPIEITYIHIISKCRERINTFLAFSKNMVHDVLM